MTVPTVTFSIVRPDKTITALIKAMEFQDSERRARRQARGITEAGLVFVQDLGREDRFFDLSFQFLKPKERSDLLVFFGPDGTLRQARSFSVTFTAFDPDLGIMAALISTDQGFSTDEGLSTDQENQVQAATFNGVFLDQDELVFVQQLDGHWALDLRLRLPVDASLPVQT